MSDLFTLDDARNYPGIDDLEDEDLLGILIDQVIDQFTAAIGRTDRPFTKDPATGRVEIKDGSGSRYIFTDYPITALTSLKLGRDATAYDETLDPTNPRVLSFRANTRRIARVDGGWFGLLDSPNYVTITYNAGADPLPTDAKFAISRRIGILYRESGRPEATSERVLEESVPLPFAADSDPVWDRTVANHREPRL